MNLPNLLTLLRIFLVPFFALLYVSSWSGRYLGTAALFGLAAFTDWLDGYVARKLNQTTPLGAFLDPVADKIIVATALVGRDEPAPTRPGVLARQGQDHLPDDRDRCVAVCAAVGLSALDPNRLCPALLGSDADTRFHDLLSDGRLARFTRGAGRPVGHI